jgi:nitrous oxidase accessory protein NosD
VGIKITAHCGVYLEGFTIMNAIASGNVPAPEDTYELSPLMDGSGIFCGADGGIWIRNVTIVNCTIGVGFINSSPCTSIANSTIRNCGTGVKLSNARGVEITNCGIIDCHVGIQVGTEAAPNIGAFMTLFDSTLLDNEVGLFMYPSDAFINSHANLIRHNNFVNPTQIFLPCGTAGERNSWDSNYWSDYLGADLNNDGYGDFPYVIDALNVDYCPLIEDPPMSFPRELLFKLGDGDSRKLCLTD